MDKTLIFAVAGAGKTTEIVERIDDQRRFLIFTYTDENLLNLRKKIIAKHGRLSPNVSVMTYFSFLHSFCFRPLAGLRTRARGLNFHDDPPQGRYNDSQPRYYMDAGSRLYVSRLAKLLTKHFATSVLQRVERFFDVVCVDEVQDFASHDFNFLLHLARLDVSMLLVGDFWQHTYDTSRDGSTLKSLHTNFDSYAKRFRDAGFSVDTESLSRSRRCSPAVCEFISDKLGVPIKTHSTSAARIVTVQSQAEADELRGRADVVKLFYKKHYEYGCHSQNWGASKGEDHYDEVCVVLNQTTLASFRKGNLASLKPQTLNRLYVALSRSRGNVYLAPHHYFKQISTRE